MRNLALRAVALALSLLLSGIARAEKPNILLIVADDLGWNDVGYHNSRMRTPVIDRLAREGVELDQHYVMPQCTPTRVALMTGRYPSRFGRHCTQASNDRSFPIGTQTLARVLREAGYETAITGKWHMGSKPEWGPKHHGFDHSHGSLAGAVGMYDHRYRLNTPYAETWHRNHELIAEVGHATDLVAEEAVRWIEKERDRPFFLYVPFHAVHTPLVEEKRWIIENEHHERYDRRLYAAAVTHMDHAIGRIVDALERAGERERTLIVFFSDNGAQVNHGGGAYPPPDPALEDFSSNAPLRGKKTEVYEGGIRVPAFASWPGRLERRKVTAPIHAVDWLPTLSALAGASLDPAVELDGRDVRAHIEGEESTSTERTFYWLWGRQGNRMALRHGDWKLVRNRGNGPWELFRLDTDPLEERDLAEARPEKVAELRSLLEDEQSRDAGDTPDSRRRGASTRSPRPSGPERPFVLWNREDLAAIRRAVAEEEWARQELERLSTEPGRREREIAELLLFALEGDAEDAEREKKRLFRMVRSPEPRGAAQWINVVRFDLLRDRLDEEERGEVERVFREYIENAVFRNALFDPDVFNDSRNYSRYDALYYTRSNWLPNITWPRRVSANLMAAALGDEDLIRRTWAHYGSWRWYFDEYLADSGFYGEEFSKMGSTPGAMLIYCRALERLGLDELGFGYTGRRGATMRGHIESLVRLGYPRVDLHSERFHYPMVTTGDLRQQGSSARVDLPTFAFQHAIVQGFLPGGRGGVGRWIAHGAWGGTVRGDHSQWDGYSNFTPKMLHPLWFEIGNERWPDAGFDYFLAQMRPSGAERYIPSLYLGARRGPIDPDRARPPAAPSFVAPARGLVMLRVEESPRYWESPAPAVSLRLAAPYAHSVNDSFALAGFYACNRPVHLNRQTARGYASGWSRSIQSHAGVQVDDEEPSFTHAVTTRHGFYEPVKFVAAESREVYEDVEQTRALFLARSYLLDIYTLSSPRERSYRWLVHTLGELTPEERKRLGGELEELPPPLRAFERGLRLEPGEGPWSVTAVQTANAPGAETAASSLELPEAWYAREVGARLRMVGEPGTSVWIARTPSSPRPEERRGRRERSDARAVNEVGGVSIIAERRARSTAFVALHEPFEGGAPRSRDFERIPAPEEIIALRITGTGRRGRSADRVFFSLKPRREAAEVDRGDERIVFADHALVRIEGSRIEAWGDVRRLDLRAPAGEVAFTLNGRATPFRLEGERFEFGAR